MSRCFPYTLRVCERKGLNGEAALIESIKLQNATEKCKTSRRREENKYKIGKTKEERNKVRGKSGDDKVKRASDQNKAKEERKAGSKRKHSETGNGQSEKSDLTIERGRPLSSQNTGYLSDSPQSNDKRSDNAKPSHCDVPQQRRIIRIRLNPQNLSKQKKETEHQHPDNSYTEQPTATIQRPKAEENCLVESISAVPSDNKPELTFPCRAQSDNQVSTSSRDRSSSSNDGLHGLEITYRNLTDNWTPLPIHLGVQEDLVDNSDWLFGTVQLEKRSNNQIVRRQKPKSSQSSRLWPPRAQYLPEGGLYALPYTVPF